MKRALVAVAVFLLSPAARAAVPGVLTFQGYLEENGVPRDAAVSAVFDLYSAESGGTRVFTQAESQLPVSHGVFSVDLTTPAGTPTLAQLFQGQRLWLEVTVNGELLSPRTPLGTVPYAVRAGAISWNDIEGIPADLADGDQDTHYQAGQGLQLNGTTFDVDSSTVQGWARLACYDTPAELQSVLDSRYLGLSGGTVAGATAFQSAVTVPTPTAPAQAATKAYVDSRACTLSAPGAWSACIAMPTPSCGSVDGVSVQQATLTCPGVSVNVVVGVQPCRNSDSSGCGG